MVNPIIIKFGGSLLEDKTTRDVFLRQLAAEWTIQQEIKTRSKIILVHGGGKKISSAIESRGIKPTFKEGRRITDEETMLVVEQVLRDINQDIVKQLEKEGAQVWGGCGKSSGLMRARLLTELGQVGGLPTIINKAALSKMLEAIELPVFYSVALGPSDETLNMNADDFAQELAIACGAEHLIFMTDTGGIKDKAGELLDFMTPHDVEALITKGAITGGMVVKARACVDALRRGVHKVTIAHEVDGLGSESTPRALGTSFLLSTVSKKE